MLYAGIDGGQSSTVAVVGDATQVLGRGTGPPADFASAEGDPRRQLSAIERALRGALAAAELPRDTRIFAAVAGISGFDEGVSPMPDLAPLADNVRVVHDTTIAHAGALGGKPGIVVIAGTGSVALGNDVAGGACVRAGGWGYFFGDEGSALWIARTALGRAMAREDRGETSQIAAHAAAFFGALSLRHIQHAFAVGDLRRSALAAFAREVLVLADEGDIDALATRGAAARALADLCVTIDARLARSESRPVSFSGGLFASEAFAYDFEEAVVAAMPHASVVRPQNDAATGAIILARS